MWRSSLLAAAVALAGLASAPARAHAEGVALASIASLHDACRRSVGDGDRELYVVAIPATGWSFGAYSSADTFLPVDTRRNLRTFRGSAELFPSRLETVGFVATPERARALVAERARGALLRLGFFLGFDDARRSACLIRPAAGVTTVRFDLAFVELTDARGRVLAREDSERLRGWLEEREQDAIPGTGPRGVLGAPSAAVGELPASWRDVVARASGGPLSRALAACHAQGVQRSASPSGEVVVRVMVDPRGAVRSAEVELTSIGDADDAACIARAVGAALQFPPDVSVRGDVALSVPVRLAAD